MEVSTLQPTVPLRRARRDPFFRPLGLHSDERLVSLVRLGNQDAFELLVDRYRTRLIAFCRQMVRSDADAEDIVQEVFAAAFTAMLADDRHIHVRPWLYRIARNRSLNHLRQAQSSNGNGDAIDGNRVETGASTAELASRREELRQLVRDVLDLPESQRTALVLREIHGLSYEQTAETMTSSVPSIKSLLVRARIGLAEAAEAREISCDDARLALAESAEGVRKLNPAARSHVKRCDSCKAFRRNLKTTARRLPAIAPFGPLLTLKAFIYAKATPGAAGAAGLGGGESTAASGTAAAGAVGITVKAVAGLATIAAVTSGLTGIRPNVGHESATPDVPATAPAAPIAGSQPHESLTPAGGVPAPRHQLPTSDAQPTDQAGAGSIQSSTPEVVPGVTDRTPKKKSRTVHLPQTNVRVRPGLLGKHRGRPAPGSPGQVTFQTPAPAPPSDSTESSPPEGDSNSSTTNPSPLPLPPPAGTRPRPEPQHMVMPAATGA